jgi:hypothetical protein
VIVSVSYELLSEAGCYFSRSDFADVVEDRYNNEICGFPICANKLNLKAFFNNIY